MAKKEEEVVKVIAPTKKDNELETLEDVPVAPVNNQVTQNVEPAQESKGKKIFGEIKAFLILIIIIGVIGGGTWYWYTHIYDPGSKPNPTEKENEAKKANVYSYVAKDKNSDLFVLGEYLIERNGGNITKIMNLKAEVLYEGRAECNYVYMGVDDNLYLVSDETGDYNENTIVLYKLVDKQLEELDPIGTKGVFYSSFVLEGEENRLIGFVGLRVTQNDEGDEEQTEYIKLLDGTTHERKASDTLFGNMMRLGMGDPILTSSDKYVVTRAVVDGEKGILKFGLYDYKSDKMVMDASYEMLKEAAPGFYVAQKEGKAGIIDTNRKIIVDYKYDYIKYFDDFYAVVKDKKIAIMDKNFNFVTGFEFDYQVGTEDGSVQYYYYPCCSSSDTFNAYKIGDKYVLVTNYREGYFEFDKHEMYVIGKDGSSEKIDEHDFRYEDGLIYSYNDKVNVYDIYDNNMKKKYTVDLSKYDFIVDPLELINENTIHGYDSSIYIDYETGEEIKGLIDFEKEYGNATVVYKGGKLTIKSGKDEQSFDIDDFNSYFIKEVDDGYYYVGESSKIPSYIFIEKGE